MVFDTGSQTLEIPGQSPHPLIVASSSDASTGTACGSACSNQHQFNSAKSSTYKSSGHKTSITFGTGVGVDPVQGVSDDRLVKYVLRKPCADPSSIFTGQLLSRSSGTLCPYFSFLSWISYHWKPNVVNHRDRVNRLFCRPQDKHVSHHGSDPHICD